jgi:hypothetical protein
MTKSSNIEFDRGITIAFVAVVVLISLWVLSNGIWLGTLFDGNQTWLIHLDSQPVWSPPATPAYADFQIVFNDLPPQQSMRSKIDIQLEWDFMLVTFFLYLLGASVLFGIHTLIRPGRRSLGVYIIRSLAISLTGAAATCFVVWLLVGGWGPPSPLFFGLVGLVVGIWIGLFTWSRRTSVSQ